MSPAPARVLLLRSRGCTCALPLAHVRETLRALPVQPLAGAPPCVAGLAVVRGEPVPVVDLGTLLAGAAGGPGAARFVLVDLGGRRACLAVEEVVGVRPLPAAALELPPLFAGAARQGLASIALLDEQLLLVLEEARLVPEEVWPELEARDR